MSENSWLKYFAELSSNEAANKNLKAFKDATVGSDELSKKILFSLTEDVNVVVLSAAASKNKVKLYHSFENLGGTRVNSKNKVVALDGFGVRATPVTFVEDSLKSVVDFKVPSSTNLKALTNKEDVSKCLAPLNGAEFKNASFVILPPFFRKCYFKLFIKIRR